jgi:hypothetical protein
MEAPDSVLSRNGTSMPGGPVGHDLSCSFLLSVSPDASGHTLQSDKPAACLVPFEWRGMVGSRLRRFVWMGGVRRPIAAYAVIGKSHRRDAVAVPDPLDAPSQSSPQGQRHASQTGRHR